MQPRVLVIGYGNPLRRDDGVGPRVARHIARWRRPGVTARALHQLTPELAADLAAVSHALFVDAGSSLERIETRRVEPRTQASSLAHTADPGRLLAWTQTLYGRRPEGCLLTIPIDDTDFGVCFSPLARQGLRAALAWTRAWLENTLPLSV